MYSCFQRSPSPSRPNSLRIWLSIHCINTVSKKHYYRVVGDLKSEGEEFECTRLLDTHPKVKRWIGNLDGHPQFSFWLQTSTDKFYPDFVCELTNGKFLVMEYKGEHLWSNKDFREKKMISERWAERNTGAAQVTKISAAHTHQRPQFESLRHTIAPKWRRQKFPDDAFRIGELRRGQRAQFPHGGNLYPYKFVRSRILTHSCVTLNTASK